jgi:hypothetical protein
VRAEHLTGGSFGFNSGTGRARGRGRSFGKLPGGEAELLRALAGAEMHRSNGSTAEQEVRCGGAGGRGARGSTVPGGLGLGFPRVRVPLFVGRRNGLGVRAGSGVRRDSRAAGVRGRRKRREEGGADGWGQRARKRGEEARLGLADGDGLAADVEAGIGRWKAQIGRCGGGDRPMGSGDRPMWSELGLGAGGARRPMWAG